MYLLLLASPSSACGITAAPLHAHSLTCHHLQINCLQANHQVRHAGSITTAPLQARSLTCKQPHKSVPHFAAALRQVR
jgi:hypothetical protein